MRVQMLTPIRFADLGFTLIDLIHLYKGFSLKKLYESLEQKGMLYLTQHRHMDLGSQSREDWDQWVSLC